MLKTSPIIAGGKGWFRNWMIKAYLQRIICKYLGTRTYKVWISTAKKHFPYSKWIPWNARKRMIQKLNDQGVPPTHIIQMSQHKNVQSLNKYCILSERQQSYIFNILSGYPEVPGPSNYQVFPMLWPWMQLKHYRECTTQQPFTLFQGAPIHGGTLNSRWFLSNRTEHTFWNLVHWCNKSRRL